MKKHIIFSIWILMGLTTITLFAQCKKTDPLAALSQEEKEGILFMREEEKLARDVYLVFYDLWEQKIFKNIAQSEQRHFDKMYQLIDRYKLEDPADGKAEGQFTNQDLQALYDGLVVQGSGSYVDALLALAEIEEIDILDLEYQISEVTIKESILQVYNNLLDGSKNHLRAAVTHLSFEGVTYEPKHLSQEAFDEIMADDTHH